jgi:hypothetical protein
MTSTLAPSPTTTVTSPVLAPGAVVTVEMDGVVVSGVVTEVPHDRMFWLSCPSGAWRAVYRSQATRISVAG